MTDFKKNRKFYLMDLYLPSIGFFLELWVIDANFLKLKHFWIICKVKQITNRMTFLKAYHEVLLVIKISKLKLI